jgi:hypothetical protein
MLLSGDGTIGTQERIVEVIDKLSALTPIGIQIRVSTKTNSGRVLRRLARRLGSPGK